MYTGICLRSVFPSMTTLSTGYLVIAQNDYIYVARSKKEMLDGTYDMNTHTHTSMKNRLASQVVVPATLADSVTAVCLAHMDHLCENEFRI